MKNSDRWEGQYCQLCWLLSTVSWHLGASQEWWQSSVWYPYSICGHNCCCYCFCNEEHCLLQGATLLALLTTMMTQKSLTDAFVAVAVKEAQASLQVLWCFITMIRDCNWLNQVYCKHFGTFMIVKCWGPVAQYGEGLVVPLHGIHGHIPLWQGVHRCLAQHTR